MVSKTTAVGGLDIGKKMLEMPTVNMLHVKQRMVLKLKAANMDLRLITTLVEKHTTLTTKFKVDTQSQHTYIHIQVYNAQYVDRYFNFNVTIV